MTFLIVMVCTGIHLVVIILGEYAQGHQNDSEVGGNQAQKVTEYHISGFIHTGTPEKGAGGSRRPSCLSLGGAEGAKVPFLNAMVCFPSGNMIKRKSYKLKHSQATFDLKRQSFI